MNWRGLKGLVLLLSITLASPSSAVQRSSTQKHWTDTTQKFSSKGHSSPATFPSSELYESGTQHDHKTADSKETPLVRLKRIKRQTEKASSSSSSAAAAQRSISNWPGTPINPGSEVLKIHDKSSLISARPTNPVSDRRKFSASHSGAYRDRASAAAAAAASRIHTKMLRKKETVNRNTNRVGRGHGGAGRVPTRKSNEISEPVQTAAAAVAGHRQKSSSAGTGGYFHHRNEQSRLESAAEFALRQRTPHKKSKHPKNRSELDHLKAGGGGGGRYGHAETLSRPRSVAGSAETAFGGGGWQANRYHDATTNVRGHGHVVPPVKAGHDGGGGGGETSHRSRRGQRSGTTAVSGGGHGQKKVRAELEHIKRMQRDLMKEISHLERMKKKKKKVQRRSASSSPSSSSSSSSVHQQNHRQQIVKANRK